MHWQEELITSREEALSYLRRNFEDIDPELYPVQDVARGSSREFTPLIGAIDGGEEQLLYFRLMRENKSSCMLDAYSIGEEFRKKGFGLIGLKAVFGAACEFGASVIHHATVHEDGPYFWPIIGTLPIEEPTDLAIHVNAVLQQQAPRINDKTKGFLERIAKISETNSFFGWRALARSPLDSDLKQNIFKRQCLNKNLQTILGEPGTKDMLSRWLGVLPPFRPPVKNAKYKQILSALEDCGAARQLNLG